MSANNVYIRKGKLNYIYYTFDKYVFVNSKICVQTFVFDCFDIILLNLVHLTLFYLDDQSVQLLNTAFF